MPKIKVLIVEDCNPFGNEVNDYLYNGKGEIEDWDEKFIHLKKLIPEFPEWSADWEDDYGAFEERKEAAFPDDEFGSIEDEKCARAFFEGYLPTTLRDLGEVEIILARDLEGAKKKVAEEDFDVYVLDFGLGKGDWEEQSKLLEKAGVSVQAVEEYSEEKKVLVSQEREEEKRVGGAGWVAISKKYKPLFEGLAQKKLPGILGQSYPGIIDAHERAGLEQGTLLGRILDDQFWTGILVEDVLPPEKRAMFFSSSGHWGCGICPALALGKISAEEFVEVAVPISELEARNAREDQVVFSESRRVALGDKDSIKVWVEVVKEAIKSQV